MKTKNIVLVLLAMVFTSCGEDRRPEYAQQTGLDRWIESVMRENYYWYMDMPTDGKLNYFNKPDDFLKAIKSPNDSYSYIKNIDPDQLKSYGYMYDSSVKYNDTAYAVRVLYVDSESPAMDATLKRGDWIVKRNGKYITQKQLDSLSTGNAMELSRGTFTIDEDEKIHFEIKDVVTVPAARITKDNPVHYAGGYLTEAGKKVGYLVYKQFKSGDAGDITMYDDQLRTVSNQLAAENIDDFILDLRYNAGGDWEPLQLLGSILAPQSELGKIMYTLTYNDKQISRNESPEFSSEILKAGKNLNLSKIYIITGTYTASIAEILMNSLDPHVSITKVGTTTKGDFTGTHPYTNEEYRYILYPVDCMVSNSKGEIPSAGYQPDHTLNELLPVTMYELGDPREYLLFNTLRIIDGLEPI